MVPIPGQLIKQGTNTITLEFPFGILTNLERIYLLGNFSVDRHTTLLRPLNLNNVNLGDITSQGLPFYIGNVTYNCSLLVPSGGSPRSLNPSLALFVPQFSSPVLIVTDLKTKQRLGRIALQPHTLSLGRLKPGHHKLAITAFGNRYNSFEHLHLSDGATVVCEPNMWRTEGDWWTANYNVKPIGVLECPRVLVGQEEVLNEEVDTDEEDDEWVTILHTKS